MTNLGQSGGPFGSAVDKYGSVDGSFSLSPFGMANENVPTFNLVYEEDFEDFEPTTSVASTVVTEDFTTDILAMWVNAADWDVVTDAAGVLVEEGFGENGTGGMGGGAPAYRANGNEGPERLNYNVDSTLVDSSIKIKMKGETEVSSGGFSGFFLYAFLRWQSTFTLSDDFYQVVIFGPEKNTHPSTSVGVIQISRVIAGSSTVLAYLGQGTTVQQETELGVDAADNWVWWRFSAITNSDGDVVIKVEFSDDDSTFVTVAQYIDHGSAKITTAGRAGFGLQSSTVDGLCLIDEVEIDTLTKTADGDYTNWTRPTTGGGSAVADLDASSTADPNKILRSAGLSDLSTDFYLYDQQNILNGRVKITAPLDVDTDANPSTFIGGIFRMQDPTTFTTDYYSLQITDDASSATEEVRASIIRVIAGASTTLVSDNDVSVSVDVTDANKYTFLCMDQGASVKLAISLGASTLLSTNDSSGSRITSTGKQGFSILASTIDGAAHIHSVEIEEMV